MSSFVNPLGWARASGEVADRFPVAPATPAPLAEIMNAAGPLMSAPSLTEDRGDHTEVWHCPPPDDGTKYQVIPRVATRMIIPTRLTVADWFELHPFMEPGPIAMTKDEWSALCEANNGEPRGPRPTMLGHPIEVVPDWPTWLDPNEPRHYRP